MFPEQSGIEVKEKRKMSGWTFDYAMEQARLVLKDNGKLHSHGFVCDVLEPIIKMIDDERKQRADNPGVWDSAPKDATFASVHYAIESGRPYPEGDERRGAYFHYRTLPKTKAREIAENALKDGTGFHAMINSKYAVDVIEMAILEYEKTKHD